MKTVKYKDKINLNTLKQVVQYVLKDNNLEIHNREIVFDCGKEARYNVLELIIKYLVIDKVINNELFIVSGLGKIKLKHNTSLDYIGQNISMNTYSLYVYEEKNQDNKVKIERERIKNNWA